MQKIRVLICFFLFCNLVILFGCQLMIEEIPGIYIAEYPYGVEQLKIAPDGNYEQSFGTSDQTLRFLNKNRWEVHLQDREIVLHNPIMVDNGFGKITDLKLFQGDWGLHIQKGLWGQPSFSINGDLGLKFRK